MSDEPRAAGDADRPARLDDASRCPRCGGAFHCGVNGATPCWCTSLTLSPALLAQLRQQYTRCLCPACLRTLADSAAPA